MYLIDYYFVSDSVSKNLDLLIDPTLKIFSSPIGFPCFSGSLWVGRSVAYMSTVYGTQYQTYQDFNIGITKEHCVCVCDQYSNTWINLIKMAPSWYVIG